MERRSGYWSVMVLVAMAVPLLAGCTSSSLNHTPAPTRPAATPTKTPQAVATPAATPTPSSDAFVVSDVVVTASAIEVRAAHGELIDSFDYFQPTDQLVVGLTEAFGADPVSTPFPGGNHSSPGVDHAWGGFHVLDDEWPGAAPYDSNHHVAVTTDSVNGIRISTVDGIAVGDNASALETAYPETSDRVTVTGQPERTDIFVGHFTLPDDGYEWTRTHSVWLIAHDPAGGISEFRAPSPNWGA